MNNRMTEQEAIAYLTPHHLTGDSASIGLTAGKMRAAMDALNNSSNVKDARISGLYRELSHWQEQTLAAESRCASLEALVRELDEVVRLFNEDCEDIPSEWLPVRARCWVAMDKVNASPLLAELRRADLSHPLVSELTGEKEGGE